VNGVYQLFWNFALIDLCHGENDRLLAGVWECMGGTSTANSVSGGFWFGEDGFPNNHGLLIDGFPNLAKIRLEQVREGYGA